MAKSRFAQYMPNRGLQLGNSIAQGASAFSNAYNQARQQGIRNQQANEALAIKRQYMDLQMQKLKKDMEPVTVNAQNIGTLKTLVQNGIVDQSTLNKYVTDSMGQLDTPAKAAYANRLASALEGGIQMNKTEAGIYEKQVGLESSENIRGSMIQSQQGIENSRASRDYQKMAQDFQIQSQKMQAEREADKKNFDLKLKEMQMKYDELTQTRQLKEKELGQNKDLKNAEIEANVATKREGYESAERRAKISAKARSSSNSQPPLKLRNAYDTLRDIRKEKANLFGSKTEITELPSDRQKKAQQIINMESEILQEIKSLEGLSKPDNALINSVPNAGPSSIYRNSPLPPPAAQTSQSLSSSISGPQSYFKDGRVGPVTPTVRVRSISTGQTGTWDMSKGKPDPTQYQVID